MLLIFPKPEKLEGYIVLGINMTQCDEMVMNENPDKTFTLSLLKHHSDKYSHHPLCVFRNAFTCYDAFQDIVNALKSGNQTFDLPVSEDAINYNHSMN